MAQDQYDIFPLETVLYCDKKRRRERRKARRLTFTQVEDIQVQKFQLRVNESFKMSESIGFGSLGATVNDRINEVPLEQESEGKVEEKVKEIQEAVSEISCISLSRDGEEEYFHQNNLMVIEEESPKLDLRIPIPTSETKLH